MKIVIWGAGQRGKRIFSRLKPGEVLAFIDNDSRKVGSKYMGVSIISLEEYLERYSAYFILISLFKPEEVICQLNERGIYNYFNSLNCPLELWGVGMLADLDRYLDTLNKKRYGIFGTDFYGIFCCDRMHQKGEKVFLISEFEYSMRTRELIEKAFDFVEFISVDDCKEVLEQIFVTTGIKKEVLALKEKVGSDIEIEDVFDLSRKVINYQNAQIAQFKNVHLGERCFIVATGPSLTMKDLDILYQNNEFSIGMNRIHLAFEHTQWRPDYYMVTDRLCIEEDEEIIRTMPIPYKFVSDTYVDFWERKETEGVYRFHSHENYVVDEKTPFSDDLIYGVYCRGTITYGCIQLAVYLGFKEIYLLGVDFSFSSNYKDKSNHFISTYYGNNSQTFSFMKKEGMESYEAAKEYADAHGIKIYNATRGGKLEVFERVDFDKLFSEK